jgi:hypothetical protein
MEKPFMQSMADERDRERGRERDEEREREEEEAEEKRRMKSDGIVNAECYLHHNLSAGKNPPVDINDARSF